MILFCSSALYALDHHQRNESFCYLATTFVIVGAPRAAADSGKSGQVFNLLLYCLEPVRADAFEITTYKTYSISTV